MIAVPFLYRYAMLFIRSTYTAKYFRVQPFVQAQSATFFVYSTASVLVWWINFICTRFPLTGVLVEKLWFGPCVLRVKCGTNKKKKERMRRGKKKK